MKGRKESTFPMPLDVPITRWTGCYPSNWKGLIVPDAIKHPAKYSSRLIHRIYSHLQDEGWVTEGDGVIDPFGGVALGALDAMRLGLSWRGVELEERFVAVGNDNIALWNKRFVSMPSWNPDAVLLKGDSRKLLEIFQEQKESRMVAMKSPPFGHAQQGGGVASSVTGESSYPVTGGVARTKKAANSAVGFGYQNQGEAEGNLSTLLETEVGFQISISSPPFRQSSGGTNVSKGMDAGVIQRHAAGNSAANGYGASHGQLANLEEGDFAAAISSPPFGDNSEGVMRASKFRNPALFSNGKGHPASYTAKMRAMKTDEERAAYGTTGGNIGNESGDDFWSAARLIVEQVYAVLKPGGHAVWVVKDYVKNKKRVPFCNQWRLLCEAVGFETLHEHHAELVRRNGSSHTLEGGSVDHTTSSKSFFRRVAERNTALNNYWETVSLESQEGLISAAKSELWVAYDSLSDSQKKEKDSDGNLLREPPTANGVLKSAKERAFSDSGEKISDWNRDVAIDHETVFCMLKR